jgi:hypothetical protein
VAAFALCTTPSDVQTAAVCLQLVRVNLTVRCVLGRTELSVLGLTAAVVNRLHGSSRPTFRPPTQPYVTRIYAILFALQRPRGRYDVIRPEHIERALYVTQWGSTRNGAAEQPASPVGWTSRGHELQLLDVAQCNEQVDHWLTNSCTFAVDVRQSGQLCALFTSNAV